MNCNLLICIVRKTQERCGLSEIIATLSAIKEELNTKKKTTSSLESINSSVIEVKYNFE